MTYGASGAEALDELLVKYAALIRRLLASSPCEGSTSERTMMFTTFLFRDVYEIFRADLKTRGAFEASLSMA